MALNWLLFHRRQKDKELKVQNVQTQEELWQNTPARIRPLTWWIFQACTKLMARREGGREGLMMSVVEGNERGRAQWVATEGRACGLNHREDKVVRLKGQSMRKGRIRFFFFSQLCLSLCVHHTSEWPTSPLGDLCSLCRKWEFKMWSPSKSSRRCDGEAAREDERASRAAEPLLKLLFGFLKK